MDKTVYDAGVQDLLPHPLADDQTLYAVAQALDEQLQAIAAEIHRVEIWTRLAEQPHAMLNLLAWELSVDFWASDLSHQQKVAHIQGAIPWHEKKGTKWAVRHLLEQLPYEVEIVTQREALERYHQAGGRFLDGSWDLDGSADLVTLDIDGLPEMDHWAEFCVVATADPDGWSAIRQAVDAAKRASTWPIYCHAEQVIMDSDPRWCCVTTSRIDTLNMCETPLLDGSWDLDGSVELEERDILIGGTFQ